jgi:hypothetical protein
MRFWLWCGGAAVAVVLTGLSIARWQAPDGDLPKLPAELVRTGDGPAVEPWRPIPCPVTPSASAEPPFEPIEVVPEPFEDEPPLEPDPDAIATAAVPAPVVPAPVVPAPVVPRLVAPVSWRAPRPDGASPRMPYADEEVSEFARLLQRAAELRGQPRP